MGDDDDATTIKICFPTHSAAVVIVVVVLVRSFLIFSRSVFVPCTASFINTGFSSNLCQTLEARKNRK